MAYVFAGFFALKQKTYLKTEPSADNRAYRSSTYIFSCSHSFRIDFL